MRRFIFIGTAALFGSGCISFQPQPVVLEPISVPAEDGVLECAMANLLRLGYSVEAAEAGVFFEAVRVHTPGTLEVLNVAEAQRTLTIVPSKQSTHEGSVYTREALDTSVSDAEETARTCGSTG